MFVNHLSWHYYHVPLQETKIQVALKSLIGQHDLAAFRRAGSEREHSWVEIQAAECYRQGAFLHLEIQANGFLYGMVRLLEVGAGKRSPDDFQRIWQEKRRDLVKYSAPAKGLCLLRVGYTDFPFSKQVWFDTQPKFLLA